MNEGNMKKTRLGKITFVFACVYVIFFVATKIREICIINEVMGSWKEIMEAADTVGKFAVADMIARTFVFPALLLILYLIYTVHIGQNKRIQRPVFALTAFILLIYIIYLILKGYFSSLYLYASIGFALGFVLLCFGFETGKKSFQYAIYGIFTCSYIVIFVCVIMQVWSLGKVIRTATGLYLAEVVIRGGIGPVFSALVCLAVLGYVLFPKKYICM